ncbi:response regulator transcription factor [Amycolatopsis sp. cg5]|uniref:response regulator transcription factor n=1 Tax=Amycolatopsis sp. cg5 TaxID=3238802 RepID=UPI00352555BD
MNPVRVAVCAADSITQVGLTSYLRSRPGMVVVAREDLTEQDVLLVQADRMTPELVSDLTEQAARVAVPTVLLAGELRESDVVAVVECNVVAVLPRSRTSSDQLVDAVRSVAGGDGALPPDLLGQLLDHVRRLQHELLSPLGFGAAGLTAREVDVLRLMAEGRDTAEIADALCYSERTVKSVIYAMTARLNLRNRPHAVAYAMRAGVI